MNVDEQWRCWGVYASCGVFKDSGFWTCYSSGTGYSLGVSPLPTDRTFIPYYTATCELHGELFILASYRPVVSLGRHRLGVACITTFAGILYLVGHFPCSGCEQCWFGGVDSMTYSSLWLKFPSLGVGGLWAGRAVVTFYSLPAGRILLRFMHAAALVPARSATVLCTHSHPEFGANDWAFRLSPWTLVFLILCGLDDFGGGHYSCIALSLSFHCGGLSR